MSRSTPVTSRDQGALQEIVTELPLLIVALKLVTDDSGPELKTVVLSSHNSIRTCISNTLDPHYGILTLYF